MPWIMPLNSPIKKIPFPFCLSEKEQYGNLEDERKLSFFEYITEIQWEEKLEM